MQFLDKTKIKIISGKGGNGMVAWRREKYVDKGGPAGGDGGRGGDVYLVATEDMSTLMDFKFKSVFKAENGENGGIKNMHGRCAKDLFIHVPVGTVVKDVKSGSIIADLIHDRQTVLVAKGGRGGRGNARFATAQKRAPQFCEPGEPSIERELELELKLIADVGLLGMPNAGKSTLISRISSAKPKIADYPFTTLVPNLGVVRKRSGDGYVVADIPGLIEGASEGVGLGHDFLRHVERCRFLVHIVDVTAENPLENFEVINNELALHSQKLADLYQIIALNKIDAIDDARKAELKEQFAEYSDDVFMISAVTAYKKACDNKIYEACVKLGRLYKEDYNKAMQKEAVKLFNTACDESIASGCFELAYLYYKGDITRKSLSKARKLFDKACSMQNAPSCFNMGIIYQQGLKVKKDAIKALEYFIKSCRLNFD